MSSDLAENAGVPGIMQRAAQRPCEVELAVDERPTIHDEREPSGNPRDAMGERFRSLLDVTIVYPGGAPTFWQFLCGRSPRIVVRLREVPIPAAFCTGDYAGDKAFRVAFQRWLAQLWEDKDRQIDELLGQGGGAADAEPARPAASAAGALAALALLFGLLAAPDAGAVQSLGASALRARHAALEPQLRDNQFQGPLYLESVETPRSSQGDVYAVVDHPFGKVSGALANPANWCDLLILHLNVKYCRGTPGAPPRLEVRIGRKLDQPLASATPLSFAWRAAALTPEYLDVGLDAPTGPFGTKDYRILVEAVGLDGGRTFIHMGYAFGYGALGQMALSSYLATMGRDKVGFTRVTDGAPGDGPRFVGGTRGLAERNTMRYYLAIDAYLDSLAAAPAEQVERRFASWFDATEKYLAQLREVDRASYLAMKRREYRRQQSVLADSTPRLSAGEIGSGAR